MLFKKMFRDMGKNKMQFLSVFLMAFLGVLIFTGIGGEWSGIERTQSEYYEQTNLADGWIWGEDFSSDDVENIISFDGVTNAQKRFYIEASGADDNSPVIYLYALDDNDICKPYIAEGEEFDSSANDKIWLDIQFAEAKNINVGDSYTISFQGTDMTRTVAGLIYSSEYQYYSNENDLWPDYNNVGFAYCSVNAIPFKDYIINTVKSDEYTVSELADMFLDSEEAEEYSSLINLISKDSLVSMLEEEDESEFISQIPYNQIIITASDSADAKSFDSDIQNILCDKYALYITRSENSGIQMLDSEVSQHKIMGDIFPIVFMLVAILAIITSMNRLIGSQRTQIGTLRATGFSKTSMIMHYVGYGFWLSLFGAVAGMLIGPITIPYLFYSSMSSYYTLPEWKPGWDISFAYVAAATVLACSLTAFFTALLIVQEAPADSLKPKSPKNMKLTAAEKGKLWEKSGFAVRWNIRNFRCSKIRTLMGAIGTIGCMALLVCAFSCYDSVSDMGVWMYDEIQICNTRFVLKEDTTFERAQEIASDVDGELIETQTIEVQANGEKITASLTACEGKGIYNITDAQRNVSAPTEGTVALSQKIADELGVKAGDTIKWHIYTSNNWVESEITIVNRVPVSQGMVVSYDVLESSGYDFEPNYVDTMQNIEQYDSNAITNIITADEMSDFWSAYMESMNMLIAVILIFAIVLAIVVLYNMGSLTFTERQRELVTLKVIGFKNSTLLSLTLMQNLILSVIGIIFGAPIGKYLVKIMLDNSGSEFDMEPSLTLASFLISAVITLVTSLLVTLLFIKKLERLDIVGELKGTE